MLIGWLTLAQRGSRHEATSSVVVWVGVLIVVALLGGIAAIIVRRRVLADEVVSTPSSLMDELRLQLKRGEITSAEFDAAKRLIVSRVSGTNPRDTPPLFPIETRGPPAESTGVRNARPGYDLTGERLPEPSDGNSQG